MAQKVGLREQVKDMINSGEYTKNEIAEHLKSSAGSVSSQMTYLRWMGHFIKWDENKKLSFCSAEEYDAWQVELGAARKTKAVSARTPEEQAVTLQKTINAQSKAVSSWEKKLRDAMDVLAKDEEDEDLQDFVAEAKANITILELKLKRNKIRAAELPEVLVTEDDVEGENPENPENPEDGDLL